MVITSAGPGEGKTTLASNLALIASHAGKTVVLVEADLRNPTLSAAFGIDNEVGLTDVLTGRKPIEGAVQEIAGERLHVLTSGPRAMTPSELLGSTAMVELLEELEARYDLVIVDTPPALPVTDALLIAVNTGGTVVVTRLSHTNRSALKKTVDALRKVNANLLGIVGNAALQKEEQQYGYGYGYLYGYVDEKPADAEDLRPSEHIQAAGRRHRASAPVVGTPLPTSPVTAAPPAKDSGPHPGEVGERYRSASIQRLAGQARRPSDADVGANPEPDEAPPGK
jgi:capsular exopolysaccharide synthesis family protein